MVTLFRLSQRRMPAVIAILAILLLFIAPEVSKSLAQRHASGKSETVQSVQPMPGMIMAGMDHRAMDHHGTHQMPVTHNADDPSAHHADTAAMNSGISMMGDIACGYCLFLLHFPLLLSLFVALILLMLLTSRAPVRQITALFPPALFTGLCQPRAPPAC